MSESSWEFLMGSPFYIMVVSIQFNESEQKLRIRPQFTLLKMDGWETLTFFQGRGAEKRCNAYYMFLRERLVMGQKIKTITLNGLIHDLERFHNSISK